jgi:hypothetical protein
MYPAIVAVPQLPAIVIQTEENTFVLSKDKTF